MKTSPSLRSRFCNPLGFLSALLLCLAAPGVLAQSATGTIEGRVANANNGEFLANARITVEGTSLEAFTDSDGYYRLTNVPTGTARTRAFFTGLVVQVADVPVTGGQRVQRDFTLSSAAGQESIVKLSEF